MELEKAITALKQGQPVVLPTDTVYGLGVAVRYAASPQAIYDIKQRVAGKPIAWLVDSPEALDVFGKDVPSEARALAASHWPGALTIIVKASSFVPSAFIPASGTIGLRMPASAEALELIRAVGPIATSSANLSGGDDPRMFEDIDGRLLERAAASVRGAHPGSGTASTVLDFSQGDMRVVRQGDPL